MKSNLKATVKAPEVKAQQDSHISNNFSIEGYDSKNKKHIIKVDDPSKEISFENNSKLIKLFITGTEAITKINKLNLNDLKTLESLTLRNLEVKEIINNNSDLNELTLESCKIGQYTINKISKLAKYSYSNSSTITQIVYRESIKHDHFLIVVASYNAELKAWKEDNACNKELLCYNTNQITANIKEIEKKLKEIQQIDKINTKNNKTFLS